MLRDDCGGISRLLQFLFQPLWFLFLPAGGNKVVNVLQTGAGENTFVAGAAKLFQQITQQVYFKIVARSKVGMAAFAGEGAASQAIPIEPGFPQTSTGSNQCGISCARINFIERDEVSRLEIVHARSMRLKIIDEPYGLNANLLRKLEGIDDPCQIRSGDAAMQHRSGYAEACAIDCDSLVAEKQADNFVQALVFA